VSLTVRLTDSMLCVRGREGCWRCVVERQARVLNKSRSLGDVRRAPAESLRASCSPPRPAWCRQRCGWAASGSSASFSAPTRCPTRSAPVHRSGAAGAQPSPRLQSACEQGFSAVTDSANTFQDDTLVVQEPSQDVNTQSAAPGCCSLLQAGRGGGAACMHTDVHLSCSSPPAMCKRHCAGSL